MGAPAHSRGTLPRALLRATVMPRDTQDAEDLLFGLCLTSLREIEAGDVPPNLYTAGVRYEREPRFREYWQSAQQTYQLRKGDCEDLSIWLCAYRWHLGEDTARAVIRDVRPGLKHCVVQRADGSIEDPSKALGMKGKG